MKKLTIAVMMFAMSLSFTAMAGKTDNPSCAKAKSPKACKTCLGDYRKCMKRAGNAGSKHYMKTRKKCYAKWRKCRGL